jgi:hypothetical protein
LLATSGGKSQPLGEPVFELDLRYRVVEPKEAFKSTFNRSETVRDNEIQFFFCREFGRFKVDNLKCLKAESVISFLGTLSRPLSKSSWAKVKTGVNNRSNNIFFIMFGWI